MKRLIYILLTLFPFFTCNAQLSDTLNKHVILAVDAYPGIFNSILANEQGQITHKVNKLLEAINLNDSDYISFIAYGIGTQDNSLDKYASPAIINGKQYVWVPYKDVKKTWGNHFPNWNSIASGHKNLGHSFSMLTGAKFYSLKSLNKLNNGKFANKTYLIMLTDNQYNGQGDMDAEFVHFMQLDANFNKNLSRTDFRNTCIHVSNNYNYVFEREERIKEISTSQVYSAILFEVRPSSSFSLNSVVSYPADLGLERIRGGYKIHFDYSLIDDDYTLKRFAIYLQHKDSLYHLASFNGDKNTVETEINSIFTYGDSVTISLKGWLEKKDDAYSGVILNPNDKAFSHLSITETLPLEDKEKILGILPLWDIFWWWFPNNQYAAVLIWDFLLIGIFAGLVLYFGFKTFKRLTQYVPNNKDIKITHV